MKCPKGLRISDIKVGDGLVAEAGLYALVRYDCFLPYGEECLTGPKYLKVGGDRDAFPALTFGIVGMAVGGVREVKVSPNLAYYERNSNPDIPDSAALRYEITLLSLWDSEGLNKLCDSQMTT